MEDSANAYDQRKELFREPTRYVPIKSTEPISIQVMGESEQSLKEITEVPVMFRPGESMIANGKYYKMEAQYEEGKPKDRENIVAYKATAITNQEEKDRAFVNSQRVDSLVLQKFPKAE